MAVKYGNLSLGQVYKLLISIIGRDAALAVANEHGIPITGKDLDRMFEEEDRSFVHFRPIKEDGAMEIVRNFLQLLEQYEIPGNVTGLIMPCFFGVYRDALRSLCPYERQTKDIAVHLLNWFLGHLGMGMEDSESQKIHMISKKSVERFVRETENYEKIFDDIFTNLQISKVDFYNGTEKFYKGKPLDDFAQTLKRDITKCCKNNTNEPWERDWYKFKAIFDFVYSKEEKELVHRLIGLYLRKNTETALKEICGIEQKDIYTVKQDVLSWAQDKLSPEPQRESQCFLMTTGKYDTNNLSILQSNFIEPDFMEQKTAIEYCFNYLWEEAPIKPERAEHLIQAIEEKCPHCSVFFGNWARARLAILSCKFDGREEDKALRYYHTAFDIGRNFAGAYLKAFIEESIAATVYFNRRRIQDIPKVIDTDKSLKTPITDDIKETENRDASYGAKQYYEYGYALNLFEQESSEAYFLHFHAEEHFWKVFSTSSFVYTEIAEERYNQDILRAKGFYQIEGGKEGLKQHQETLKQKLRNVTKENINRRMEVQLGHNIQYTPLSVALNKQQLDIAEHYLNDFVDSLDVTVINTHGSTALLEALTQYNRCRFSGKDEQTAGRYKKIIIELIKRSPYDSLYAETVKSHISVLEEAINSYDIEIIKAIFEKKCFDIQNLKISADELSPLYYAIQRLLFVDNALLKGYIDSMNIDINWEKLNVPGMFTEDKQTYMENMKSNSLYKDMVELSLPLFVGVKSIWKQEFSELKEIVKYLIDKTNEVDKFIKEAPDGNRITALAFAAEADFDDICRLLIEKGANLARIFGNRGMPCYSPFFRAAWFESWKTLEMFLLEFKEKIKPIINERYRKEQYTAAHLLFKVDYSSIHYKYEINHKNFKIIERFIPLFRNTGADFSIPDHRNITVRQILKQYNLNHLLDI